MLEWFASADPAPVTAPLVGPPRKILKLHEAISATPEEGLIRSHTVELHPERAPSTTSWHGLQEEAIDKDLLKAAISRCWSSAPDPDGDPCARDVDCFKYVGKDAAGRFCYICADCNYLDVMPTRVGGDSTRSTVASKAKNHASRIHKTLLQYGFLALRRSSRRSTLFRQGRGPAPIGSSQGPRQEMPRALLVVRARPGR